MAWCIKNNRQSKCNGGKNRFESGAHQLLPVGRVTSHYMQCQTPSTVYDILPSTTAVFSYAIGSKKLSANEQFCFVLFCWCSNYCLSQTTHKTKRVIYSRQQSLHQHKQNHNRLNRDGTLFSTRGGCVSCLRACLGARLFPQSYQYPNSKHRFATPFLQPLPYLVTP